MITSGNANNYFVKAILFLSPIPDAAVKRSFTNQLIINQKQKNMQQQTQNGSVTVENTVPSTATFTLTLSKLLQGASPVIANAKCEFTYIWDFTKNMGLAHLISIDNCAVNITLHPLGIAGTLDFMSDIPPTNYVINGQRVVLNRIILDINLANNARSGAIMFNNDGSVIEATDNFDAASTARFTK